MPQLVIKTGLCEEKFLLYKRLTSIGKYGDIVINDPNLPNIIAYINQTIDGFDLTLPEEENKNYTLKHNATFSVHGINFIFKEHEDDVKSSDKEKLLAYRKLVDFSLHIAKEQNINTLLETLLKEIINIVNAEYGFLVLIENDEAVIKTKHYIINKEDKLHGDTMSDSIVKKVLQTKAPIIINDATNDAEFSSTNSVINFRLTSVMCVPLIYQTELLGAIYVGNNAFSHAFNEESLEMMSIFASQAALLVENALHINALTVQTKNLQESLDMARFGGIIGACPGMQNVFFQIQKVSASNINILITGETGTGKELIARELHNRSDRKEGSFVILNCGAIPENLLESELFGQVRGAFLGALQTRIGKIQQAHNGTLFLDDISELPLILQIKLLSVLEDQSVCKVGDSKGEKINIRVIAATHQDLLAMILQNTFRQDLYYRLNEVQINVPPLKDRGNDVLVLTNYFLQKYAKVYSKNINGLDKTAKNTILNCSWPGNVRQLENRIKRAIVMCKGGVITKEDLDLKNDDKLEPVSLNDAIERFRKRYINESLARNAYNRTKTALELKVDPRTIFRHLKKGDEGVDA